MTGEPTATIDDESFAARVCAGGRATLVLFTAEDCLSCHFMAEHLPTLVEGLHRTIDAVSCPAERSPRTFAHYGVVRTPTLILFIAGQPVAIRIGALPRPRMHRWVADALHRTLLTSAATAGDRPVPTFLERLVCRPTITRACRVASVVAPVLLLLNHADLVLSRPLSWAVLRQLGANFIVPYLVSSYSSARAGTPPSPQEH